MEKKTYAQNFNFNELDSVQAYWFVIGIILYLLCSL